MPSVPEFLYRARRIRAIEILHKADTHYPRTAYGDIGISREITVYLNSEKHRRYDYAYRRGFSDIVINRVDITRQNIGDSYLLKEADSHFLHTEKGIFGI